MNKSRTVEMNGLSMSLKAIGAGEFYNQKGDINKQ